MEEWKLRESLVELRNCIYQAESALDQEGWDRMVEALGRAEMMASALRVAVTCQAIFQAMSLERDK